MRHILIIILSLAVFTSCMTRKKCMQYCEAKAKTHITDTNTYIERLRDTTIVIPPDSTIIQALLECDSLGKVRIKELEEAKGKGLVTVIEYRDNVIYVKTKIDENKIRLKYLDIFKGRILTKTVVQTVEVKRPINKFFFWGFIVGWGIIAIYLLLWYLRRRYKLLFGISKNYD